MLEKLKDALAHLLTRVPYGGFNMERGLRSIAPGIVVNTHSGTHENQQDPTNSNYFILPKLKRDSLYGQYQMRFPLLIEDAKISFHLFPFWVNETDKKLIDFSWVYAFIAKIKTADCILLSKALCWLLITTFNITKRVEIIILTSNNTLAIFHAFIVVNRAPKSIVNQPETWGGDQAIIIDPWHKICFTANKWEIFKEYLPLTNKSINGDEPTYYGSYFDSLNLSKKWREAQAANPWRIKIKEIYDQDIITTNNMPYRLRY